jgi:hypothetical protein
MTIEVIRRFTCDCCGKVVEDVEGQMVNYGVWKTIYRPHLINSDPEPWNTTLCPDCIKSFERWFDSARTSPITLMHAAAETCEEILTNECPPPRAT